MQMIRAQESLRHGDNLFCQDDILQPYASDCSLAAGADLRTRQVNFNQEERIKSTFSKRQFCGMLGG